MQASRRDRWMTTPPEYVKMIETLIREITQAGVAKGWIEK